MGTSIPNLFPNRFQESIFHPLTRLQIPALYKDLSTPKTQIRKGGGSQTETQLKENPYHATFRTQSNLGFRYVFCEISNLKVKQMTIWFYTAD
jgi:hypothetical protein